MVATKGNKMSDASGAPVEAVIDAESAVDASAKSVGAMDVVSIIKGLNDPDAGFYSSIEVTDFASRKSITKAVTSSLPIDENLNKPIALVNFIVMPVDLMNDDGVVNTAPRVILIANDGIAYHGTSIGLLTAIRNIITTLGEPSEWPEPVDIKVVLEGVRPRQFFTVNLV